MAADAPLALTPCLGACGLRLSKMTSFLHAQLVGGRLWVGPVSTNTHYILHMSICIQLCVCRENGSAYIFEEECVCVRVCVCPIDSVFLKNSNSGYEVSLGGGVKIFLKRAVTH